MPCMAGFGVGVPDGDRRPNRDRGTRRRPNYGRGSRAAATIGDRNGEHGGERTVGQRHLGVSDVPMNADVPNEAAVRPLPPPAPGVQPAPLPPAPPRPTRREYEGERPPRPRVLAALVLVLVGAVMSVVGSFLPWWDGNGYTRSGIRILFARTGHGYRTIHGPGYVVIALAAVCAILGLVMLFIGRSITLSIVAIVAGGVGFLYSLACLGIVQDTRARVGGGTISVGVPVVIVGAASTLVGSVMVLARRRYPREEAEQ